MHKLMTSTDPDELCPFPSPYLGKYEQWQRDLQQIRFHLTHRGLNKKTHNFADNTIGIFLKEMFILSAIWDKVCMRYISSR